MPPQPPELETKAGGEYRGAAALSKARIGAQRSAQSQQPSCHLAKHSPCLLGVACRVARRAAPRRSRELTADQQQLLDQG